MKSNDNYDKIMKKWNSMYIYIFGFVSIFQPSEGFPYCSVTLRPNRGRTSTSVVTDPRTVACLVRTCVGVLKAKTSFLQPKSIGFFGMNTKTKHAGFHSLMFGKANLTSHWKPPGYIKLVVLPSESRSVYNYIASFVPCNVLMLR